MYGFVIIAEIIYEVTIVPVGIVLVAGMILEADLIETMHLEVETLLQGAEVPLPGVKVLGAIRQQEVEVQGQEIV